MRTYFVTWDILKRHAFKGQELIFFTASSRTSLSETDFAVIVVHCECVVVKNTTAGTVWWHCLDLCQGSSSSTLCCFSTINPNAT